VNPNYLQRYPAYDASGSRIYVDDTETSWVVLVPIRYRDQEDLIRLNYQQFRNTALLDADYFESEDQERLKNQPVKIIWTANNQNYFTFNPRVDYVTDPLIQVMTLSNSLGDDRLNAFGLAIDSALKVYLGNNSSARVLATLEPTLSRLNLDDNFVSLLSFSEYSEYVMNDHNFYLENWGIRIGILFFVMMLLIVQSAAINYERESRRIAVFKIQGYKFLDRYIKPIFRFSATWLIIAGTLAVIYYSPEIDLYLGESRSMDRLFPVVSEYNQFLFADPMLIFEILAIILLLDALITVVTFRFIESRRVVTTLKGET
jgi:hypothetical protein